MPNSKNPEVACIVLRYVVVYFDIGKPCGVPWGLAHKFPGRTYDMAQYRSMDTQTALRTFLVPMYPHHYPEAFPKLTEFWESLSILIFSFLPPPPPPPPHHTHTHTYIYKLLFHTIKPPLEELFRYRDTARRFIPKPKYGIPDVKIRVYARINKFFLWRTT
jgi:hypothetical protein